MDHIFGWEREAAIDLLRGRLKLRHLVVVVAVADHGSVLRAADRLTLAQPAVTRCLRELEHLLGVQLFVRGPRGMTPTPSGEVFLEHARTVLAELRRAGERVSGHAKGVMGTVRVGTLPAGSSVLLPQAIADLKRSHPDVTVVVDDATFGTHAARLLSGELDLIVGRLNPITRIDGLRQIRLRYEPMRLVVRREHPALTRKEPTLAGLLDHPWILPLQQTVLRREVEQAFADEGLELPTDLVECASILTVRALLRQTDMIAVLPESVAAADRDLAALAVPLEGIMRPVGVTLVHGRPLAPPAARLLDLLRVRAAAG
ncbi:LysR substrate-binding domain-containing protein [Nonomuraea sp. NPDC050790]|uniref:LysR substrate-binding domain-containing protein n=1 Tax=Nonomuraea sp. NPDC050790 TaxID=3364371 RepID=UPI0037B8C864